jgi:hypothetical protein|tara:strand:+ start:3235 stop:5025 length:1791 start_codon:yes stop_codon:yes gene_type:complete
MAKKTGISQRKQGLTDIIEMKSPPWLTEEVYNEYLKNFKYYQNKLKIPQTFSSAVKSLPGIVEVGTPSLQYGSVSTTVTAKFFVDMWNEGRIISPPSTGQDPKSYSKANQTTASEHFANMWGDENGTFWLREGVLNLVLYPKGKYILEATDIEHRLWGIIGGALGLIPLKSSKKLYFSHPDIDNVCIDSDGNAIMNSIEVNNLTITQIREKANELSSSIISHDDILERYFADGHKFPLRILPMYSEKECHEFYGILNKQQNKSEAQLLHATTYPSNFWIKEFSSIKMERFSAGNYNLHPLFKQLFPSSMLISLESFMWSHLLFQNITSADFKESTDAKIKGVIENTYGYQKLWEADEIEDIKEQILEKLDILYKFYSQIERPRFSRQAFQHILKCIEWLDEENHVIYDWNLFSNKLYKFIETDRLTASGIKSDFGVDMGGSSKSNYKSAFQYIKTHFLQEYVILNKISNDIGCNVKSERLPRLFLNDVIDDSEEKNKGNDIDNTPIRGRRVGGHIISDYELVRMTDGERVQAFIDEGLGDKFDFDLNCRAMSSYHNLRMSILRLSEYLSVMNESDEVVKQKIREKKESLKHKSILV